MISTHKAVSVIVQHLMCMGCSLSAARFPNQRFVLLRPTLSRYIWLAVVCPRICQTHFEPTNHPCNQPATQPTNQQTNQRTNPSTHQFTKELTKKPTFLATLSQETSAPRCAMVFLDRWIASDRWLERSRQRCGLRANGPSGASPAGFGLNSWGEFMG